MEDAMENGREVALVDVAQTTRDLTVGRPPEMVVEEARRAAKTLTDVIKNKKKPVMFNGEQYLEQEDWALLGKFYNITAKVTETKYVEFGETHGFEAKAVAYHIGTGQEISAAEALCLNDEQNWSRKPLFQLKSMAQTRACGKVLRNVLSWVVVLGGFKPTPAEEMEGVTSHAPARAAAPQGDIAHGAVGSTEARPGKEGVVWYKVMDSEGASYVTKDKSLFEAAEIIKGTGEIVAFRFHKSKQGTVMLDAIEKAVEAEEAPSGD